MKNRIIKAIDEHREDIIGVGKEILAHPELGYKEFRTSACVKHKFDELGIKYTDNLAITGVKGVIGNPNAKYNVCVIGELDAVKCYAHPNADKITGAAHACGHNVQIANLIGVAYGLKNSGVLDGLDAKVTLFAVPAEEFVELEYRKELVAQGKIKYMSGKQELIHLGEFSDVDVAIMVHSKAGNVGNNVYLGAGSLGFKIKNATFYGKAAHGSTPDKGVNALNSAILALSAINANRETFRDEDTVRILSIMTSGGELVNVVPEKTGIESQIRANNSVAIEDACNKVDNCIKAGAMAIGCDYDIETIEGYKPLKQDQYVTSVFERNVKELVGDDHVKYGEDLSGSTDMGDLSEVVPSIHPLIGGFCGNGHAADFGVVDEEFVYITASKMIACTVYDLIKENCTK